MEPAESCLTLLFQILYLHLLSYGLAVALTKVSIIFFVRRIAGPGCSRVLKWILWGNFWYMVVFQIALVLLYTFQCMPAGSTWDLSMRFHPDTHCVDHLPLYYVGSAVGIRPFAFSTTDQLILLLSSTQYLISRFSPPQLS